MLNISIYSIYRKAQYKEEIKIYFWAK